MFCTPVFYIECNDNSNGDCIDVGEGMAKNRVSLKHSPRNNRKYKLKSDWIDVHFKKSKCQYT